MSGRSKVGLVGMVALLGFMAAAPARADVHPVSVVPSAGILSGRATLESGYGSPTSIALSTLTFRGHVGTGAPYALGESYQGSFTVTPPVAYPDSCTGQLAGRCATGSYYDGFGTFALAGANNSDTITGTCNWVDVEWEPPTLSVAIGCFVSIDGSYPTAFVPEGRAVLAGRGTDTAFAGAWDGVV